MVDKNEEVIYSDIMLRGVNRFVNDTKRIIRGSREGIITVMLKNFIGNFLKHKEHSEQLKVRY